MAREKAPRLEYLLTLKDGSTEKRSAREFSLWVRNSGELVGSNFQTRLAQLQRWTGKNIIDWEMLED